MFGCAKVFARIREEVEWVSARALRGSTESCVLQMMSVAGNLVETQFGLDARIKWYLIGRYIYFRKKAKSLACLDRWSVECWFERWRSSKMLVRRDVPRMGLKHLSHGSGRDTCVLFQLGGKPSQIWWNSGRYVIAVRIGWEVEIVSIGANWRCWNLKAIKVEVYDWYKYEVEIAEWLFTIWMRVR